MPPPQRKEIGRESPRRRCRVSVRVPVACCRARPCQIPRELSCRRVWITECCRWRKCPPLSCLLFLVLFVFVSCVVPLSTPSSTHVSTTSTTASLFANNSFPNNTLFTSSSDQENPALCKSAREWIREKGSFCFTLRDSPFLKDAAELSAREARAIDMFCHLDVILEKVDCDQPYSVNKKQCWLCREAYRDWVCAMSTDTLEDGQVDCEGGVMPCPSCASICHQVMRLCPYLTPDRVQGDESGDPTAHVSQYGGHPAFYCPLENIHASDPAYRSDCSAQTRVYEDPDYVHNLCAADARFMSKRSAAMDSIAYIPHYSTCCWTYASSLVQFSGLLEKSLNEHGNRVILNCCDEVGNCDSSDPARAAASDEYSNSSLMLAPTTALPGVVVHDIGSTLRTANNQVRGEDGKFRELSNAYMHDESLDDDEEEDEEYYEESSAGEMYSGGSVEVQQRVPYRRSRILYEPPSSSVISIHRDNKIYSTRESRSVHDMYIEPSSSGGLHLALSVGCVVMCALTPPLLCALTFHSLVFESVVVLVVSCVRVVCLFAFRIVTFGFESSIVRARVLFSGGPCATTTIEDYKYRTFECVVVLLRWLPSQRSQLMNLPINLLRYSKSSQRKLVVIIQTRRYIIIVTFAHT